jgi:hypothetical protein
MKNKQPLKKSIVIEPIIDVKNDIVVWSYNTKRNKSQIVDESNQLINEIGDYKLENLDLIKKMINLHNEYRFPIAQLTDTSKKSVDIAHQFLIFLKETSK